MEGCVVPEEDCGVRAFIVECEFFYYEFVDAFPGDEHFWGVLEGDEQVYARVAGVCVAVEDLLQCEFHVDVLSYSGLPTVSSVSKEHQGVVLGRHDKPFTEVA